ncbi:MAG TPA: isocitrate lyase/PEP mutase family protein [Usitatibacter sp.]|nr:isocitrate lyase/PEP mutase family protein [Usitatibacter sp.]
MGATKRLRELLRRDQPLVAAGAYDGLSARMAAQAGFEAIYASGSSIAASLLGQPDVGLTTFTEMADQVRRMAAITDVPLVADADTGYGSAVNVMRTVREYERAGAAGLHIEDQVMPKKCGHFEGKALVPAEEMVGKVRAAIAAREDPDFLLIARTDARTVAGLPEAIRRARMYVAAGADAIFVETPRSVDEYREIRRALPDTLLIADVTEGGKSPALSAAEYHGLGFQLVFFSASAIRAVMHTLGEFYAQARAEGTTHGLLPRIAGFEERNRILDLAGMQELDRRFSGTAAKERG